MLNSLLAAWENYDISTYGLTDHCSASELPSHMVGITGIGPVTSDLSGLRSNQLSYTPITRVVYRDTSSLFHICKRFELFIGSDPKHPGQMIWSGWLDSNQRLPVSKTGGIPLTYTLIWWGLQVMLLADLRYGFYRPTRLFNGLRPQIEVSH